LVAFPAEIIFKATDQVSGKIRRMGRGVNRTMRLMSASVNRLDRNINKLGGTASAAFGALGLAGGVFAVQRAMQSAIITGATFEQTLVNASAKFPGGIKRGTAAFNELEEAAADVGRTTVFTASEAAGGLNFLAMAGFNAKQSIAALPIVTKLAVVSQTDLAEATDIATDALGAMGLESDDAATKAANLNRVVDVMAKTTTTANTDMRQLFEAMKEGGPVAVKLGGDIETFAALAGELANAGIKGSNAGTTLKNVFLRLAAPTKEAAKVMKGLGVEAKDVATGNMRDVVDILGDLGGSLDGLGSADRAGVLDAIFGKIPIAGVNVLLQSGSDKLRDYRKRLEDAKGTADEMAKTMGDTVTASFKTLLSSVESVGIGFFKLNRGAISETIETATSWVRTVDDAIRSNQVLAQEIQGNLFNIIKGGGQIVGGFIVVMIGLKVAVFAARTAIMAYNITMGVFKGIMFVATVATKGFALAFKLVNLAMKANPIGLIITGVGLLGTAAILLISNWDKVGVFFTGLWASIISGVDNVVSVLSAISSPFKTIFEGVSGLKGSLSGILGGDDTPATPSAVSSPEARTARSIEERTQTNRTEITVSPAAGASAARTGPSVPGVTVLDTAGAF